MSLELGRIVDQQERTALRAIVRMAGGTEKVSLSGRVSRALHEELTERQAQMVEMYYAREMRMQDIADDLGLNVSTVSRTLARARQKLVRGLRYSGGTLLSALDD